MRSLHRIRKAEAQLEKLFYKAALRTVNAVLADLGADPLSKNELVAAPTWRADQFNRLLALWASETGKTLTPAVLSLYRSSAAQTLKRYPALTAMLKTVSPGYLDSIRNIRADAVLATLEPNIAGFGQQAFTKVTSVLQVSLEQGLALDKTQELVRKALKVEVNRARTIARTMAGAAVNGADHAVFGEMVESGINIERRWMATGDRRTRETHRHLDGEPDQDGGWNVGGAFLKYPGDPSGPADEVINCRCTTVLIPIEA